MRELILGKVSGVFGIKGWLKVSSYTDIPEDIFAYPGWTLMLPDGKILSVELQDWKAQGKGLIVKVKGVADRSAAMSLAGAEIRLNARQLPELDEGEFYHYQLEGLRVLNLQQDFLGKISSVLETGANDVLVVIPGSGSVDVRERLIPYLPRQTIIEVQLTSGRVLVDWPTDY